jgi:NAD+ synthase (glutamine-hydrolysing)
VLFPELCLSAYSCEDLFHQEALLDECRSALQHVVDASRAWPLLAVVGMPLVVDQLLYNCAVVLCRGQVVGIVPKTYLPNYREFYERRQFAPGDAAVRDTVECCGQRDVPFGSDLLFRLEEQPLATFHVEICEDLWVPVPPSSEAALAGATALLNLSASNVTVAKADTGTCSWGASPAGVCRVPLLGRGHGSTTDLHGWPAVITRTEISAESRRSGYASQLVCAEATRAAGSGADAPTSFAQAANGAGAAPALRRVPYACRPPRTACRSGTSASRTPSSVERRRLLRRDLRDPGAGAGQAAAVCRSPACCHGVSGAD